MADKSIDHSNKLVVFRRASNLHRDKLSPDSINIGSVIWKSSKIN